MTITLEIGPELQAELLLQAAAHRMGIDEYVAHLLQEAARVEPKASAPSAELAGAIEQLKVFGKTHGLSLQGTTIRELRHEARP